MGARAGAWQIIALGRYIIWGWPEADAGGDLKRVGIDPDPVAYHGSNEMLLAPWRTEMHAPWRSSIRT